MSVPMPLRERLRSLLGLFVGAALVLFGGQAASQEQIGVRQAGTGRLRGRVVNAQTGLPVRDVSVLAVTAGTRETQRGARTDANGQFEIVDLPAGRYIVTASKVGYVPISYGQRRALEAPRPIALADKEVLEKVDFRLPRGGVIAGRILDEFGDPLPDTRVQVTRLQYVNGQRRAVAVGDGFQTDDLGRFRIYDLSPGDYYISAAVQAPPNMVADTPVYARMYFPGTLSVNEAQPVSVDISQEVSGLEFSLRRLRTVRISGVVLDSTGRPQGAVMIAAGQAQAMDGGMMFLADQSGQSRADGSFLLSSVMPGEYVLQARQLNGGPGPETTPTDMASVVLSVGAEDISGVRLVMSRGGVARGQFVGEDGRPPQSLHPSALNVMAVPLQATPLAGGRGTVRDDDWSFEITGVRDRSRILVRTPPAWRLKSISYNGEDVTDRAIDFGADREVSGIQITLTERQTDLSGAVLDARGDSVQDYVVVVFAEDEARWGFPTRFISTGRPDQDGRFRIRGLPSERYAAVAVEYLEPGEELNPQTLERLRPSATIFALAEGEVRALDLKLSSY
jgi:hypothetical protein